MTVATTTHRADALGNGAAKVYPFAFRILSADDLLVSVEDTAGTLYTLARTTDYTVSGVGAYAGGSITLVDNDQAWLDAEGDLKTDYRITIRRRLTITQLTDLRNRGGFFPEDHETAFDRLTMIALQQQDEIDRSIKFPETDDTGIAATLPAASARASKFVAFDANGNVMASVGNGVPATAFMATVLDDPDAATARATLGVTLANLGVSAFIQTLLDDASLEAATDTLTALPEVANMATLRELAWANGRRVRLRCHTNAGDGGHGVFRRVTGAAPGTYTHNGGTVLVAAAGDGSAAWLRELDGAEFVGVQPSWGSATTLRNWIDGLKTGASLQHTKWVLDNTVTGDSILEIVHGTSAGSVTAIEAKHSGIRVERWLNKTVGNSTARATGTQGDALSAGLFECFPAAGSQQTFALRAGVFVGTPRASGVAVSDMVALYGEAQRTTGSDGVWALNTITEVSNLAGPTIGYELDVNNKSGFDPGVNPAQSFWGLSIVNGAEGRGGTGIIVNRNGDFANNEWNRGIYVKEVLKIGIEIGNKFAGTWDAMLVGNQLANGKDTILLMRNTDVAPTGQFFRCVNAANNVSIIQWNIDGQLKINAGGISAESVLSAKQIVNGEDVILLQRNTDVAPTGQFLRCINAADSINLFQVKTDAAGSDTVLKVSVAGAEASTVSVGAADSGGAGYRVLRVPN